MLLKLPSTNCLRTDWCDGITFCCYDRKYIPFSAGIFIKDSCILHDHMACSSTGNQC